MYFCRKITSALLHILSCKLNISNPALPSLHEFDHPVGTQMRLINFTRRNTRSDNLIPGVHTDFGSLTILFNNIGSLQVLLSPEKGWLCVPPGGAGRTIINFGDAMVKITDGLFRSATCRFNKGL
jgi:isopenicillin N synthase-like dioxygenase